VPSLQAVAQFLFKNNLPASAVAQAFSQVAFNNSKMNSAHAQAYKNLTPQQQFMANFGIAVANIAASIGGSVAGAKLFQSLGLNPQIGAIAGGVVSQQVVSSAIAQAAGTAGAKTFSGFVTGLGNAGGAAIGSYVGVQLAQLTLGSLNQGASFGGAVGTAVGAYYGAEIGATIGSVGGPLGATIGATIGSYIGSLFGSFFGPGDSVGPNANAVIGYNASTNQFSIIRTNWDNGGNVNIAISLGNALDNELNGVLQGIGGHITNAGTTMLPMAIGYFSKFGFNQFVAGVEGDRQNPWNSDGATDVGIAALRELKSSVIQGGNPFMEYALAHSTATTIQGLTADLNAANDYGQYLANPLAFDASLAMSGSQAQLMLAANDNEERKKNFTLAA